MDGVKGIGIVKREARKLENPRLVALVPVDGVI